MSVTSCSSIYLSLSPSVSSPLLTQRNPILPVWKSLFSEQDSVCRGLSPLTFFSLSLLTRCPSGSGQRGGRVQGREAGIHHRYWMSSPESSSVLWPQPGAAGSTHMASWCPEVCWVCKLLSATLGELARGRAINILVDSHTTLENSERLMSWEYGHIATLSSWCHIRHMAYLRVSQSSYSMPWAKDTALRPPKSIWDFNPSCPPPKTHQSRRGLKAPLRDPGSIWVLITLHSNSLIFSGQHNRVYFIRHVSHSRSDGPNSRHWVF